MTLLFPSQSTFPETCSICCCRTHVAASIDNHLLIFKIVKNSYIFDFALELPDKAAPSLTFSNTEYNENLYLAAYSYVSVSIINISKRKIVASVEGSQECDCMETF